VWPTGGAGTDWMDWKRFREMAELGEYKLQILLTREVIRPVPVAPLLQICVSDLLVWREFGNYETLIFIVSPCIFQFNNG